MNDLHYVVTGGTGALGQAVVSRLLATGATVHVPVFQEAELERAEWRGSDRVRTAPGVDLADEAAVAAFYDGVPGLWGSIHLAGGFAQAPIEHTPVDQLTWLWRTNFLTCFLACREAARRMADGGRIVNVAARPVLVPAAGVAAYAATKGAVATLTRSLAEELAPRGIWVNAVVPSTLDTPANRAAMPDAHHASWPSVDDVAATILFLASPENRVSRGALVPVYGRS